MELLRPPTASPANWARVYCGCQPEPTRVALHPGRMVEVPERQPYTHSTSTYYVFEETWNMWMYSCIIFSFFWFLATVSVFLCFFFLSFSFRFSFAFLFVVLFFFFFKFSSFRSSRSMFFFLCSLLSLVFWSSLLHLCIYCHRFFLFSDILKKFKKFKKLKKLKKVKKVKTF